MKTIVLSIYLLVLQSCGQTAEPESSQIRVVWHENPHEAAIISWTSLTEDEPAGIFYGIHRDEVEAGESDHVISYERGQYHSSLLFQTNNNPIYNLAKLENLSPDTLYYFRLDGDPETSILHSFKTAPDSGDFKLLVGGDSRSDQFMRLKMNYVMQQVWSANPDVYALVHGGDYVEDGKIFGQWSQWFDNAQIITKGEGQLLPIVPTRGNHEDDPILYNQIFGYPGPSDEAYFNLRIVDMSMLILNTEISLSGNQMKWLQSEYENMDDDVRWRLVNYHKPAFPVVKAPSSVRGLWVPLFEKYGVQVAFESDGHAFKKTAPIYKEKIDHERGIVYIGEGGLGVKQRSPKKDKWYLQEGGIAMKKHHVMTLEVTRDRLEVNSYSEDGEIFNRFEILPRREFSSIAPEGDHTYGFIGPLLPEQLPLKF